MKLALDNQQITNIANDNQAFCNMLKNTKTDDEVMKLAKFRHIVTVDMKTNK